MRGTFAPCRETLSVLRIIPACAGNISSSTFDVIRRGGSSPRVRGTFHPDKSGLYHHGIIPACAGNIMITEKNITMERDHPRVCGEHAEGSSPRVRGTGSSPRVRGTFKCKDGKERTVGIIPACAGNISIPPQRLQLLWDHPRVCGEHVFELLRYLLAIGSSPRVRGTSKHEILVLEICGIIPACAGNIGNRCSYRP